MTVPEYKCNEHHHCTKHCLTGVVFLCDCFYTGCCLDVVLCKIVCYLFIYLFYFTVHFLFLFSAFFYTLLLCFYTLNGT